MLFLYSRARTPDQKWPKSWNLRCVGPRSSPATRDICQYYISDRKLYFIWQNKSLLQWRISWTETGFSGTTGFIFASCCPWGKVITPHIPFLRLLSVMLEHRNSLLCHWQRYVSFWIASTLRCTLPPLFVSIIHTYDSWRWSWVCINCSNRWLHQVNFYCAPTEVRYTCGEASMQVNW